MLTTAAWLAMAAYSLHIMEEFMFDWRNWAREVIKLPVEWPDFYITNSIVVAVGIAQAMLAPALPLIPLAFAGLMLINALFFHFMPMMRARGRFSPGAITGLILFLPSIAFTWWAAVSTGVADIWTVVLGVVIGAVLMAYPIVMLKLRSLPYFRQDRSQAALATVPPGLRTVTPGSN
jgi:peptidoglycan biosynthesis protein MviN/MurJ (putative lipid II flippase)